MVAGYRACWQATHMLVHPLMKLARSLKTNSPAQLFSRSSCELRHAFRPCWIRLGSRATLAHSDRDHRCSGAELRSSFRTAGYPAMVVFGDSRCPFDTDIDHALEA